MVKGTLVYRLMWKSILSGSEAKYIYNEYVKSDIQYMTFFHR